VVYTQKLTIIHTYSQKINPFGWALVAHNLIILATWEAELRKIVVRSEWPNSSQEPQLQNNQNKMDLRCGFNCRAQQVESPEFKLQSHRLLLKI
jgi:hypothetical protein